MFPLLLPLRLWRHFGNQRLKAVLAILTVLPDPLLMVGIPVLLQLVIDQVIDQASSGPPVAVLLLLPCAWLLVAVACNGLSIKLFAALGSQLGTGFRQRLFGHLLEQANPSDGSAEGSEQGLLALQIPTLENAVVTQLPLFTWTVAQLFIGVLLLFTSDWRLALVAVVLTPLLLVSQVAFTPALARREEARVEQAGLLLSYASERLRSRELVDLFGLRSTTRSEFNRRNRNLMRWAQRVGAMSGLQQAALTASAMLTLVSVFALGTWLVLEQQLTVGQLVSALGIATAMVSGMWQLGASLLPLQAATTALNLLEEQLPKAKRSQAVTRGMEPSPPALREQLAIEHVQFRYPGGGGLNQLNLTIPANSSLALVGPSGGGKSTVLRLLLRQIEPQQGCLLVDGVPLGNTDRGQWLEEVALVPQETVLFDLSIADNIRLGRLDASDQEVQEAAMAAELGDLIHTLPDGLQTPVGPGGGRLSGGQKQRIAIARAIVRNPRLLLLDEATSALDPNTEEAINTTLRKLSDGRTVVSVLHRLRAAAAMDQIAVIDRGQVVELGHHNDLLAAGGLYASFWHRQMSGFNLELGQRVRITPERLATIPLFHGVDPKLLVWLASEFVSDRIRHGEEVFREGDAPDAFYVVVAGTLEVLQNDLWGGIPIKQGLVEEGDFFGDAGLIDDQPRAVTVRARGDGLLLRLDRDRFLDLLDQDPDYRRFFLHSARASV
ncbi:ATP-binding cassette domain-containing protein [Synechococcus sp. A10-1-5-1]|uniref:ATP-binding cassette domain-containing protein n=1 Tax=Synechococcus sp. A10-1-5-1 TaxID=2936507 RepID=UPI0020018D80|nr:ABC transporter transmembrane domain-containing protein [Synechococcus sp. A10-1-5-1]UPM49624.1 ATP-binding cassette domain-containing protein [Synechococcus sp. A10-1-5-1]